MEVILSPVEDLMNSLLMKMPVGNVILRPFGAVRFTSRSDILRIVEVNVCLE